MSSPLSGRRFDWLAFVVLGVVVGAAYGNTLDGQFVYDDRGSIVHNFPVHWRELGLEQLREAWFESRTRRFAANWSFGLTYYGFGLDVRAYHATNIAIHLLASCFVYALSRRILEHARTLPGASESSLPVAVVRPAAFAAALVFAVHPLQTQAVAYVVQRMASMAGMFALGSLLLYMRGRATDGGKRVAWWGAAFLSWLLAVGSKESAATFPAVIWAYEWIFYRGGNARWALRSVGALVLVGAAMVAMMFSYYSDPMRDYMYHDFGVAERLLSQGRVFVHYATLIAWPLPSRLVLMHEFAPSTGPWTPPTTLLAWAAIVAAVGWLLARRRAHPTLVFGMLLALIAISIESSIFPLRLVHEHRLYLPLAGIGIALSVGIGRLAASARVPVALGVGALVLALAWGTHLRNRVWETRESLWADVVAKSPGLPIGYLNLGAVYMEEGSSERALDLFLRAREVDPDFGASYRALGTAEVLNGRRAEAIPLFEKAFELDPIDHLAAGQLGIALYQSGRAEESLRYFQDSIRITPDDQIVNHYGKALFGLGRIADAEAQHLRALDMNPDYAYGHLALGVVRAAQGRSVEARRSLERALEIEELADAHIEMANLAWSAGESRVAIGRLRRALEIDPEAFVAENNLAWMLATTADSELRDGAEALDLAERAQTRTTEVDPGLLDTVAAAQAASGRYVLAAATAEDAMAAAYELEDLELAEGIEERLHLYRSGRSWIAPQTRAAASDH